jgi:glucose/arabinose dehydrogenase
LRFFTFNFTVVAVSLLVFIGTKKLQAATFANPKITEQSLATDLDPTAMEFAPDGRLFICSKNGAVRIVKDGKLLTRPFLKLTVPTLSEQGLLGIAFHPTFTDSPYVYLYYTALVPQHNRVSRFLAQRDTVEGEEQIIFDMDLVTAQNHMAGAIHFGLDGKLYIASGNSAKSENSLSLNTTLGKILRINPNGSIPNDNPFLDKTSGNQRAIWALGIRNTFSFAIDRITGRIFGTECGDGMEEVNELLGGSNYGYGEQEGYAEPRNPSHIIGAFRPAIYAYSGGCVIAAAFYPSEVAPAGPMNFPPEFQRKFFFADHNNGWIKVMSMDNQKLISDFATGAQNPVDIKFGSDGALYYLSRSRLGGSLMKVIYNSSAHAMVKPSHYMPGKINLQVVHEGRIAWQAGARTAEIHRLDGTILNIQRPSSETHGLVTLPDFPREGIYFIRFR